jgi:hypothetical protein
MVRVTLYGKADKKIADHAIICVQHEKRRYFHLNDQIDATAPTSSSQHRPEDMVPKCGADAVVSRRKSVMALMMLKK